MEELIYDYEKKLFTIKELSSKYHIGQEKVRLILKENSIEIRTNSETAILKRNRGYTLKQIENIVIDNYLNKQFGQKKSGEQFNLDSRTVKNILKKYGIEIRDLHTSIQTANKIYDRTCQQYYKNKDFFKNETSDMAWLLGFLAADGNVSKNGNRIRIELSFADREILERIKKVVEIDNPIYARQDKKGFNFVSLDWSCKEHKEDLTKYGIIPNKTSVLAPPRELNPKFYIDYIRGYFDGNGTINLNKGKNANSLRWGICGASKEMLKWILKILEENYNIPSVNLHKDTSRNKDFYSFVYSTNSTKKNYSILYTENSLFLKRKKDKFDFLINNYLIIE